MPRHPFGSFNGKTDPRIYQLEIVLNGLKPPIWRRLLVHGNASLNLVHCVFQVAMGWTNSHLHQFLIGRERTTDSESIEEPNDGPYLDSDDAKTTLAQAVPKAGMRFIYEYDFGDSWEHLIAVEQILWPDESFEGVAFCLDGGRACPPEDCGGIGGYADLLKIIKNPKHREHQAMITWLGRRFDPELFDAGIINTYLRMLKRPRTTDTQLAKILQARDGCL